MSPVSRTVRRARARASGAGFGLLGMLAGGVLVEVAHSRGRLLRRARVRPGEAAPAGATLHLVRDDAGRDHVSRRGTATRDV